MSECYPIQVSGVGSCPFNYQILRRIVLVPLLDSTGAVNKFESIAEVTKANIQEKFDETSELNRYYSTPLLENVDQPRAETTFFEYNSGNKARVKQGTRTFTGWWSESDPQFLERMQSWYNQEFGFFGVDKWGNFVYSKNLQDPSDTGVYPIPIDGASWDVNMVTATDSDPYYTMVQYDYKQDFNDAAIRYIGIKSLDFDGRTTDFYGLLALVVNVPTTTPGSITIVDVTTDYNTPVSGLLFGDFVMYDIDNEVDLNVTAAVENTTTPGRYTLTSDATSGGAPVLVTVMRVKYQTGSTTFEPSYILIR